jgi:hypothetical protein
MDLKTYKKYWKQIAPVMRKKMTEIKTEMKHGLVDKGFSFGKTYQSGDEEWSLKADIADTAGNIKATLEFTLYDSEFNEATPADSVCLNVELAGFNATTLARYCPYNYTPNAFTQDVNEIISRIRELEAQDFAQAALNEFNADELLNKEFEEHIK